MAARRKGKTGGGSAKRSAAEENGRRQMLAVIWLAVALFLFCVVLIKGQNVWLFLHNVMFGIFGVTAYFYPVLLGVAAVLTALGKLYGSAYGKLAEVTVLSVLVGAAIDIFTPHSDLKFWAYLSEAYTLGTQRANGGFLGALLGYPLYQAFGNPGAGITVILLIFVFLMLLTGTTIIALFKTLARPVEKISEQAGSAYAERMSREAEKPKGRKSGGRGKKEFDVDIPVDDIPEKREKPQESLSDKQKKLVDSYYDSADEPPKSAKPAPKPAKKTSLPEDETDSQNQHLSSALAAAAEENRAGEKEPKGGEESIEQEVSGGMTVTEDEGYKFPPLSLLKEGSRQNSAEMASDIDATAQRLVQTLKSFGVETRIVDISRGPTVTRYELQPSAGVKISKITGLADDIALNLATAGVRIEAPIPNKAAVGIEVPNRSSAIVGVREILESPAFTSAKSKLTIALGRDIGGNIVTTDIGKMPHGLIAGATGSGKSVCINSIIMSLLYKATPDEVKLLMVDPKVVELGIYNGIPHLLVPVVTEPRKAAGALGWAVSEMEKRYKMFADRGVRDIEGYNRLIAGLEDEPELEKLPHIVIIIDELADLMMTAPNEVEDSINRIAAKARAAGMHLIIATQRPSVDVVTGTIKNNIPTRIAFAVSSQVDSRTILDHPGADKLLGRGDMLFSPVGSTKPIRLQGCFVSDSEVEAVVNYVKGDHSADYDGEIMVEIERQAAIEKKQKSGLEEDGPGDDPMLEEAIKVVVENGLASTSLLQRKLKLGYARAARIIDEMEARGVVGPYEGSKPRKVLMSKQEWMEREASGAAGE